MGKRRSRPEVFLLMAGEESGATRVVAVFADECEAENALDRLNMLVDDKLSDFENAVREAGDDDYCGPDRPDYYIVESEVR